MQKAVVLWSLLSPVLLMPMICTFSTGFIFATGDLWRVLVVRATCLMKGSGPRYVAAQA